MYISMLLLEIEEAIVVVLARLTVTVLSHARITRIVKIECLVTFVMSDQEYRIKFNKK